MVQGSIHIDGLMLKQINVASIYNEDLQHDGNRLCEFKIYSEKLTKDVNYTCHICNVQVSTLYYKEHFNSRNHKLLLQISKSIMKRMHEQIRNQDRINVVQFRSENEYFCDVCNVVVYYKNQNEHEESNQHNIWVEKNMIVEQFHAFYIDKEIEKKYNTEEILTELELIRIDSPEVVNESGFDAITDVFKATNAHFVDKGPIKDNFVNVLQGFPTKNTKDTRAQLETYPKNNVLNIIKKSISDNGDTIPDLNIEPLQASVEKVLNIKTNSSKTVIKNDQMEAVQSNSVLNFPKYNEVLKSKAADKMFETETQRSQSSDLEPSDATILKAPMIPMETYLYLISLWYPQTYSLKANDRFIEITTLDEVKVRVSEHNFHCYLYISKGDMNDSKQDEVECWACDADKILVGKEIEEHKYTIRHMQNIMKDIEDCNCLRMLDPERLYCIICFEEIAYFIDYARTYIEHINSEHHQENLRNAIIKDDGDTDPNKTKFEAFEKMKVPLEAYLYFINIMFPVSYTMNAVNNIDIEIVMVNGDKVKLSEKDFHGFRDLEDVVECWTCESLLFSNNEVHLHKHSLSHITHLMLEMADKHCLKEVSTNYYRCILCFEYVKRLHKVEHIETEKHKNALKHILIESQFTDSSKDESLYAKQPAKLNIKKNEGRKYYPLIRKDIENLVECKYPYLDKHHGKEKNYKTNYVQTKLNNNSIVGVLNAQLSDTDNPNEAFCKVCKVKVIKSNANIHIKGSSHNTEYYKILENNHLTVVNNSKIHCKACNYYFLRTMIFEHIDIVGHRIRLRDSSASSKSSSYQENCNKENANKHSSNIVLNANKNKPLMKIQGYVIKNTLPSQNVSKSTLGPVIKGVTLNNSNVTTGIYTKNNKMPNVKVKRTAPRKANNNNTNCNLHFGSISGQSIDCSDNVKRNTQRVAKNSVSKVVNQLNKTQAKDDVLFINNGQASKSKLEQFNYSLENITWIDACNNTGEAKCKICDVIVPNNERNIKEHLNGNPHKSSYRKLLVNNGLTVTIEGCIYCSICKLNVQKASLQDHLTNNVHVLRSKIDTDERFSTLIGIECGLKCTLCDVTITGYNIKHVEVHLNGNTHKTNAQKGSVLI